MTMLARSTAGAPVPSMSTALVKACAGWAAVPVAPTRAGAREVAANRTTARMSSPPGTPKKRRSEGRRVPVSALGFT
jgi:hypothetical protein